MSISGIGSYGAGSPSQLLAALLSKLDSTQSATNATSTNSTSSSTDSTVSDSSTDNSLTGSGKGDLSAQILGLLMMMQNDPNASGSATSSTSTSSSTSADPLAKLVSAIDTDGDGSITKSEMESYITGKGGTGKGGTAGQADSLFSALDQNGSESLTQTQLASDLQNASQSQAPGGTHGHHHHGGPPSADDVASKLVQAMDTSGDGTVSKSEFENFVTSVGGTTDEADTDYAALDTQNSGSVTASQFSDAIKAFEDADSQTQSVAGTASSSPILTLLDVFAKNASSSTNGATANVTA